MERIQTASIGTGATRLALLLGRIAAIILLFVLPVHATAQQIACEHLPTGLAEAADGFKADKVLRADGENLAGSIGSSVQSDAPPIPDVMAMLTSAARWRTFETVYFSIDSVGLSHHGARLGRAPPDRSMMVHSA